MGQDPLEQSQFHSNRNSAVGISIMKLPLCTIFSVNCRGRLRRTFEATGSGMLMQICWSMYSGMICNPSWRRGPDVVLMIPVGSVSSLDFTIFEGLSSLTHDVLVNPMTGSCGLW